MADRDERLGYDAAALGNHEFNYGLDTLRKFEDQCDFPLLSARTPCDEDSGGAGLQPYVLKRIKLRAQRRIKVGILGLIDPGIAIWDKDNVEGRVASRAWSSRRRVGAADAGRRLRRRHRLRHTRGRPLLVLR